MLGKDFSHIEGSVCRKSTNLARTKFFLVKLSIHLGVEELFQSVSQASPIPCPSSLFTQKELLIPLS